MGERRWSAARRRERPPQRICFRAFPRRPRRGISAWPPAFPCPFPPSGKFVGSREAGVAMARLRPCSGAGAGAFPGVGMGGCAGANQAHARQCPHPPRSGRLLPRGIKNGAVSTLIFLPESFLGRRPARGGSGGSPRQSSPSIQSINQFRRGRAAVCVSLPRTSASGRNRPYSPVAEAGSGRRKESVRWSSRCVPRNC